MWKLADAKNRFSEVVRRALEEGPQLISRRKDSVVVLSSAEYERLLGKSASLGEFLLAAPDLSQLDLDRRKDSHRELEL